MHPASLHPNLINFETSFSVVCLDPVLRSQQIRELKCRHVFHRECLEKWYLQDHFNCPLCHRAYFVQESRPMNDGSDWVWMVWHVLYFPGFQVSFFCFGLFFSGIFSLLFYIYIYHIYGQMQSPWFKEKTHLSTTYTPNWSPSYYYDHTNSESYPDQKWRRWKALRGQVLGRESGPGYEIVSSPLPCTCGSCHATDAPPMIDRIWIRRDFEWVLRAVGWRYAVQHLASVGGARGLIHWH